MKHFLIITLIFLSFCGVFGYLYDGRTPQSFLDLVAKQQNPFTIQKSDSKFIWQRAKDYLEMRKNMIVGGNLQINDSIIYMPYYDDYQKGNSLWIERHEKADSVSFLVMWWYSGETNYSGAKEIALYMQQGIERSHYTTEHK